MLYKADTPRLRSTMQNICFLISISAVTLKLISNGQNHIHFWLIPVLKNSMTWHFLISRSLSSKLEFVNGVSPVILRSRRENAHLLVNKIPKLTIVLIWETLPCLKFGKTSNRDVKKLPQRKLWVSAANNARSHKNLITPNFGERVLLRKRYRSSHSRIRINLDPMSVYYEWVTETGNRARKVFGTHGNRLEKRHFSLPN